MLWKLMYYCVLKMSLGVMDVKPAGLVITLGGG